MGQCALSTTWHRVEVLFRDQALERAGLMSFLAMSVMRQPLHHIYKADIVRKLLVQTRMAMGPLMMKENYFPGRQGMILA